MIYDAQDGTSGRRVWQLDGLDRPIYVIAATEAAARAWLEDVAAGTTLPPITATDRGSADRTEVTVWRDETRLDPTTTDTDNPGGA